MVHVSEQHLGSDVVVYHMTLLSQGISCCWVSLHPQHVSVDAAHSHTDVAAIGSLIFSMLGGKVILDAIRARLKI